MGLSIETQTHVTPEPTDDLSPTDKAILVTLLDEVNCTPEVLAAEEYHDLGVQNHVQNRMKELREKGYVEVRGRGLYRLTETGREFAENSDAEVPTSETDETRRA